MGNKRSDFRVKIRVFLDSENKEIKMSPDDQYLAIRAIEAAEHGEPICDQSGYIVRVGMIDIHNKTACGGNMEWGVTNSSHGETSVLNHWVQKYGSESLKDVRILAFILPKGIAKPCAHCLEMLQDLLNVDNILIVSGEPNGDILWVMPLKDYYPKPIEKVAPPKKTNTMIETASISWKYSIKGLVPKKLVPKIYGVAIKTKSELVIGGRYIGRPGFHPVYPIKMAISAMISLINRDPNDYQIAEVVTVGWPNHRILLPDLQELIDQIDIQRTGGIKDLISLKQLDMRLNEKGLWEIESQRISNTDNLLPYPFPAKRFGSKHLGPDFRSLVCND